MEDRPRWCSRVLETGNGKANPKCPPSSAVSDPTPPATATAHQPPLPLLLHGVHTGSPSPGLLLGADDVFTQKGVVVPGLPFVSPIPCPTPAVLPQGAGLHALPHRGLLPPVVPAPLHQPAGPLVHGLLLPVPGPGHGKPVALLLVSGHREVLCGGERAGGLTPPALRPLLWVWGHPPGRASRGRRGWDGAGAAGASLSPAPGARSSSRCPTRRSPCC